MNSVTHRRRFVLTPFGRRAPAGAAACDGLVDGAAIDLSHWRGNRTPKELKEDTSVEIALAYEAASGSAAALELVCNNHFDTDGVLAVWTLLEPDAALEHANLIVAAAEVGDFDEWPADERGLQLDAAIGTVAHGLPDAVAYERVLAGLSGIVQTLTAREDLWGAAWSELVAAYERARSGALRVERVGPIAILWHAPGVDELPGPVLSRLAPANAARWLLAFEDTDGRFRYRYEMRRWSWADTTRRPTLTAPSRNAIASGLGAGWALKGELGMSGLLRTTTSTDLPPRAVAERILAREPLLRAA